MSLSLKQKLKLTPALALALTLILGACSQAPSPPDPYAFVPSLIERQFRACQLDSAGRDSVKMIIQDAKGDSTGAVMLDSVFGGSYMVDVEWREMNDSISLLSLWYPFPSGCGLGLAVVKATDSGSVMTDSMGIMYFKYGLMPMSGPGSMELEISENGRLVVYGENGGVGHYSRSMEIYELNGDTLRPLVPYFVTLYSMWGEGEWDFDWEQDIEGGVRKAEFVELYEPLFDPLMSDVSDTIRFNYRKGWARRNGEEGTMIFPGRVFEATAMIPMKDWLGSDDQWESQVIK